MTHHFSHRFHKEMWIINPGEFMASGEDIVIGTILGSCISVVLHDSVSRVGGMNHFLLSDVGYHVDVDSPQFLVTKGRFGIHAMELLINEMLKKGASRKELQAKVFGGANMLISSNAQGSTVPQKNIEFALRFLEKERIRRFKGAALLIVRYKGYFDGIREALEQEGENPGSTKTAEGAR